MAEFQTVAKTSEIAPGRRRNSDREILTANVGESPGTGRRLAVNTGSDVSGY